ncbi:c-type cytochrome domain-containing protein [Algoriphagus namhaensis]
MLQFIWPLFGRFHPLLVHLPLGILFMAVALIFLSRPQSAKYLPSIQVSLLLGAVFALLSSLAGVSQYLNEGYTWNTVKLHLVLGWASVVTSFYLYFLSRKITGVSSSFKWKSAAMLITLTATGHFGGNITHGEDYFLEVLPTEIQALLGYEASTAPLTIPAVNWQDLNYYGEVIQPILNHNCASCHNSKNLKGELNLTSYEQLARGGEDGPILLAGDPGASPLLTRLLLPREDEEHMPPKEKRQPREAEIELIRLWIQQGAPLDQTLGEAGLAESDVSALFPEITNPFYPESSLPKLPADLLDSLRSLSLYVQPIAEGSSWIEVSAVNFPRFESKDFRLFQGAKNHIVHLDLSNTQVDQSIWDSLANLTNLTVLKLNKAQISGDNLGKLKSCEKLKLLYLNETLVNLAQFRALHSHPSLQKVYAYGLAGNSSDFLDLSFEIETGAFDLPPLASDTIDYLKD